MVPMLELSVDLRPKAQASLFGFTWSVTRSNSSGLSRFVGLKAEGPG